MTEFSRVRPVRVYERIVEQVEAAIASGSLRPGERLPSERDLVTQFGASRATVREALRVLEAGGVVRSRPGDPHGPEVLPFTTDALTKQVSRLATVEHLGIGELLAYRMVMDAAANQLAAVLRTDAQLARMEEAIELMRHRLEDGFDAFSRADVAFHEAVAEATGNTMLQVCTEVVREVVVSLIADKIASVPNSRELMQESLGHHAEVVAAIRARDGALAARLAKRHLYDYYSEHVPVAERAPLQALLDD